MSSSSSLFVAERLIAFAFLCAFISYISQIDGLFDATCGLYPSVFALPAKILCVIGSVLAFISFLCVESRLQVPLLPLLGLLYLPTQLVSYAAASDGLLWTRADVLLLEVALLLGSRRLQSRTVTRFFLVRVFLEISGSRLISGFDLKTASLNQTFPFAPLWHLHRLPASLLSLASCCTVLFELGAVLVFSLAPKKQESCFAVGVLIYTVCMQLIGNFCWSMTLVAAAAISLVPDFVVEAVLGRELLLRWGVRRTAASTSLQTPQAPWEQTATEALLWLGGWTVVCLIGWTFFADTLSGGGLTSSTAAVAVTVTGLVGGFAALGGWRRLGMWLSLAVSAGELAWRQDDGTAWLQSYPASASDRRGLIFQVRTDAILPEDRIYELALTGNFHVGEARPGHLLFALPRAAAATKHFETSEASRRVVEKLRGLLVRKETAIRSFFADSRLNRLATGNRNVLDVVVYVQHFKLTERVADHTWFSRLQKFRVIDRPATDRPVPLQAVQPSCVLQAEDDKTPLNRILNLVPLQSATVTAAIAALIAKIIFSLSSVRTLTTQT